MKRLHVHVAVKDLEKSLRFYSHLFAAGPTVRKADYAKWMLEDPRVNFAISQRGLEPGVQELGIQAETREELRELQSRLQRIDRPVLEEGETACCYAQSEKSWIGDPQGQQWEIFLTTGTSADYGRNAPAVSDPVKGPESSCCEASCCSSEAR
jgi:hypothetical protein